MITEEDIRREYASVIEATKLLAVNDSRIRQILREGRLYGAFKFADTWLIPRCSIEDYPRRYQAKKSRSTTPDSKPDNDELMSALAQNAATQTTEAVS